MVLVVIGFFAIIIFATPNYVISSHGDLIRVREVGWQYGEATILVWLFIAYLQKPKTGDGQAV